MSSGCDADIERDSITRRLSDGRCRFASVVIYTLLHSLLRHAVYSAFRQHVFRLQSAASLSYLCYRHSPFFVHFLHSLFRHMQLLPYFSHIASKACMTFSCF